MLTLVVRERVPLRLTGVKTIGTVADETPRTVANECLYFRALHIVLGNITGIGLGFGEVANIANAYVGLRNGIEREADHGTSDIDNRIGHAQKP